MKTKAMSLESIGFKLIFKIRLYVYSGSEDFPTYFGFFVFFYLVPIFLLEMSSWN